jgi:hypothetical protein
MKIAFLHRVHALLQEAASKNTVSAYPGIISMSGSIKTAHFYVVQLCGRAAHTHILSRDRGKKIAVVLFAEHTRARGTFALVLLRGNKMKVHRAACGEAESFFRYQPALRSQKILERKTRVLWHGG